MNYSVKLELFFAFLKLLRTCALVLNILKCACIFALKYVTQLIIYPTMEKSSTSGGW